MYYNGSDIDYQKPWHVSDIDSYAIICLWWHRFPWHLVGPPLLSPTTSTQMIDLFSHLQDGVPKTWLVLMCYRQRSRHSEIIWQLYIYMYIYIYIYIHTYICIFVCVYIVKDLADLNRGYPKIALIQYDVYKDSVCFMISKIRFCDTAFCNFGAEGWELSRSQTKQPKYHLQIEHHENISDRNWCLQGFRLLYSI